MNLVDFDFAKAKLPSVIQEVPSMIQTALGDLACAWIGRARLDTVQDVLKRAM